jgi:hypothetical protein
MIYRSNLQAPDLLPHFPHVVSRPLPHSFGHDVPSDWSDKPDADPIYGIYKKCGMWTQDEAAILYSIALQKPGNWLDIGAHTGWTAAHIAASGGSTVVGVEPMLELLDWYKRFRDNTATWRFSIGCEALRADQYFAANPPWTPPLWRGVVIDGDHDRPSPLGDALASHNRLRSDGVILFHDAIGAPVWSGIYKLLEFGYRCHIYLTPHITACCWRPGLPEGLQPFPQWTPPMHVPDPATDWKEIQTNHMEWFAWDKVTVDAF